MLNIGLILYNIILYQIIYCPYMSFCDVAATLAPTGLRLAYIQSVSKQGNRDNRHNYVTSWCLSINNKTLVLLSQMSEHEWFEGTLSEMALR